MTKWIETATRIRQLLARDAEPVKEDEVSFLIEFYGAKASPTQSTFDPDYLRHLLSRPRQQLTPAERADLLAFRAVISVKAQGMLAVARQEPSAARVA